MSEYDYGNARVRAMKSRLLSRSSLELMAEAGSVDGLIAALTDTPYRQAVEAALLRWSGLECLAEALRANLVATVGKARTFYQGAAGALAALALRRYDLHNLIAVLRGLARHVPPDEILASTLPVGELRPADLAELAGAADFRAALDLLATWRLPLAQPVLKQRAVGHAGEDNLFFIELALQSWHMQSALQAARAGGAKAAPLHETLMLEADATNILTVLRLAGVMDPASAVGDLLGAEGVVGLFVGPGRVRVSRLAEAANRRSAAGAAEVLAPTPYGADLAEALVTDGGPPVLSAVERALRLRQIRHAAGLFARDPLGIGVLLGYVALKMAEISNLRAIAQGLVLKEKPDRIRAELLATGA